MSIRFAGSSHVDARRRRRLAQEGEPVGQPPVHSSDQSPDTLQRRLDLPVERVVIDSPVASLVRPQLWIHWSLIAVCLLAWGGMLYIGDLVERTDFGLREIVGLRSGRLTTFFSTLMLLWSGQLALLIYWYRRKSRNDFHGRYRLWLWAGATLQLFLIAVATGGHGPFSRYMQAHYPMDLPRYDVLCWLVPVATVSLALLRLLNSDMQRCRSSRVLLWIAGVAAAVSGTTLVVDDFLPGRWHDLLQIGSSTFCHLSLAASLLMHARFVIHVNNEPPHRLNRETLWSRLMVHLPRLPRSRSATAESSAKQKTSTERPACKPRPSREERRAAKKAAKGAQAEQKRGARSEATRQKAEAAAATEPPRASSERRPPQPIEKSRTQTTADGRTHRIDPPQPRPKAKTAAFTVEELAEIDGPIDPELMQGLSKKERRRLRKLHREHQQAARSR